MVPDISVQSKTQDRATFIPLSLLNVRLPEALNAISCSVSL